MNITFPNTYDEWVSFLAGLFDGDGFVKVKHHYSIDVGFSCGQDAKGQAVLKLLKLAESRGLFDIGFIDARSCKVYLRTLSRRTLQFLRDLCEHMTHPEHKFKIERFLYARGVV